MNFHLYLRNEPRRLPSGAYSFEGMKLRGAPIARGFYESLGATLVVIQAAEIYTAMGRWLGRGLANLAAVIDPTVFVIGGGVSEAGELLLVPARQAFSESLTGRGFRPVADVRLAELGPEAGLVGAADLARRRN